MIFGYANGYAGYIPDVESFSMSACEMKPSFVQRAGKYAGEKIIAAGKEMLQVLINE